MVTLSIGESRPHRWKPIAWLIELVEKTDHTHSFSSWKDPRTGIRIVGEARGGGCRVVTNHHFKKENRVVRIFQYKLSEDQLVNYEKYVWEQMGKPYGTKHIAGLFLMRTGVTEGNIFKDGDFSQICAELSIRGIAQALNIPLPKGVEDWGLREMHAFNMHCYRQGLCEMASQEKINKINGSK